MTMEEQSVALLQGGRPMALQSLSTVPLGPSPVEQAPAARKPSQVGVALFGLGAVPPLRMQGLRRGRTISRGPISTEEALRLGWAGFPDTTGASNSSSTIEKIEGEQAGALRIEISSTDFGGGGPRSRD